MKDPDIEMLKSRTPAGWATLIFTAFLIGLSLGFLIGFAFGRPN